MTEQVMEVLLWYHVEKRETEKPYDEYIWYARTQVSLFIIKKRYN